MNPTGLGHFIRPKALGNIPINFFSLFIYALVSIIFSCTPEFVNFVPRSVKRGFGTKQLFSSFQSVHSRMVAFCVQPIPLNTGHILLSLYFGTLQSCKTERTLVLFKFPYPTACTGSHARSLEHFIKKNMDWASIRLLEKTFDSHISQQLIYVFKHMEGAITRLDMSISLIVWLTNVNLLSRRRNASSLIRSWANRIKCEQRAWTHIHRYLGNIACFKIFRKYALCSLKK